jgi:hypothetical protein
MRDLSSQQRDNIAWVIIALCGLVIIVGVGAMLFTSFMKLYNCITGKDSKKPEDLPAPLPMSFADGQTIKPAQEGDQNSLNCSASTIEDWKSSRRKLISKQEEIQFSQKTKIRKIKRLPMIKVRVNSK